MVGSLFSCPCPYGKLLMIIHGSHGVSEIEVECVCGDVFPWSLILLRSDVITASLSFGVDQLRKKNN